MTISGLEDVTRFLNSSFLSTIDLQFITWTFNVFLILFFLVGLRLVLLAEHGFGLSGVEVVIFADDKGWLAFTDISRFSKGFGVSKESRLCIEPTEMFRFSQSEHFHTPTESPSLSYMESLIF